MKLTAPPHIGKEERRTRIEKLCTEMEKDGIGAVLVGPTASLRYFTGVSWHPSERFTGALIRADGTVEYITPAFERDKVGAIIGIEGNIYTWQE
jgi:Xaa-Pro dipeptidase